MAWAAIGAVSGGEAAGGVLGGDVAAGIAGEGGSPEGGADRARRPVRRELMEPHRQRRWATLMDGNGLEDELRAGESVLCTSMLSALGSCGGGSGLSCRFWSKASNAVVYERPEKISAAGKSFSSATGLGNSGALR